MDYYLVAGFLCWHSWAIWKSIYCSKLLQIGWPQAENAYVLKTLSGSILLTDGRTLISAEVWVFWVLALVPINFSATKMSLRCLAIWKVQICADNPLSGKISIRLTELSEQRSGPVEVFGPVQGQGHRAKMTLNWFKANSGNPCFYTSVHIITGKKHDFLIFSIIFLLARIHIERPPRYFGHVLLERQTPNFSCVLRALAAGG